MTYINLTNVSLANHTGQILQFVNRDISGGWFAIFTVIVLFVILITITSKFGAKNSYLFSAFFVSIISGLLFVSALVSGYVFIVAVINVIAAVILYIFG